MKCGNCGRGNEANARICACCGATLVLTDYFRSSGFVEKQPLREMLSEQKKPARSEKTEAPKKQAAEQRNSRRSKTGTTKPRTGKTQAPKQPEKRNTKQEVPARKAPAKKSAQAAKEAARKPKKSSAPTAYNKTTAELSIAEKVAQKKNKKKRSFMWLLPVILILVIAVGMFVGSMFFYQGTDRYTQMAERFVEAVVMDDADAVAECVHDSMYGSLRSLGYENVQRCDARTISYEELDAQETAQQLLERFGIEDAVTGLYRVHVGYTVYGDKSYACTMDVLVANIGGEVYAIKTENIEDSELPKG